MRISLTKLSQRLSMSAESTRRLLSLLLPSWTHQEQFITLPASHPLSQSLRQARGSSKPLYTLSQLSNLYEWHKQNYSVDAITLKLNQMQIPIYSRGVGSKGFVYLSDLISGLQNQIDSYYQTSEKLSNIEESQSCL